MKDLSENKGRKKKITLKDIAKKTGFSANTISRALKNKEDISKATREYIYKVSKEMGYIPNSIAGSLRSGKTRTIATIVPDISDPLIAIWVKDIETRLRLNNYNTFIINTEEEYEIEEDAIFFALSKNVDGIILCPTQKDNKDIKFLINNGVPFVLLGRRFYDLETDYVISDDVHGSFLAIDYLIKKGHKKILFMNGPGYISSAKERLEGYKKAFVENNVKLDENLIKEVGNTSGYSIKAINKIIQEGLEFSAVFAFSDIVAWEIIYALQNIDKNRFKNIPVIGFDNIQSRFFYPYPLTTVNYSKKKIAYKAVDILLSNIEEKFHDNFKQYIFETNLIVR
ncbi:MAG: LacI family transcriptional regulator [Actinobacteria bacterium]|nr:LacI family transcriptional regulator [Cyanobacteriota bacterium]MCL5771633.1 LacI family transcriptional regulator [Actinomycetota bacterium]